MNGSDRQTNFLHSKIARLDIYRNSLGRQTTGLDFLKNVIYPSRRCTQTDNRSRQQEFKQLYRVCGIPNNIVSNPLTI